MIRLTTTIQARIIKKCASYNDEEFSLIQLCVPNRWDELEKKAHGSLHFWDTRRSGSSLRTRVDVDDRRDKGKLGFTAVMQGGLVIEKAGVGVTMLSKKLNERMAKQMAHNHPDLQVHLLLFIGIILDFFVESH